MAHSYRFSIWILLFTWCNVNCLGMQGPNHETMSANEARRLMRTAVRRNNPWLARATIDTHGLIGNSELGTTSLYQACYHGNESITRLLLLQGVNPNEVDTKNNAPIHAASFAGNADVIHLLVDYMDQFNLVEIEYAHLESSFLNRLNQSSAPLHIACYYASWVAVQALLERGADLNVRNKSGRTPVYYALLKEDIKAVQLLMAHGASSVDDGQSLLKLVLNGNAIDFKLARYLVVRGAVIDFNDDTLMGNLFILYNNQWERALVVRDEEEALHAMQSTLTSESDLNTLCQALALAAGRSRNTVLAWLLNEHRSRFSATNTVEAINAASYVGNADGLKMLLSYIKPNSDIASESLAIAAAGGNLACVQLLIKNGVQQRALCESLARALQNNKWAVVKYLIYTINWNNCEQISFLMRRGVIGKLLEDEELFLFFFQKCGSRLPVVFLKKAFLVAIKLQKQSLFKALFDFFRDDIVFQGVFSHGLVIAIRARNQYVIKHLVKNGVDTALAQEYILNELQNNVGDAREYYLRMLCFLRSIPIVRERVQTSWLGILPSELRYCLMLTLAKNLI